MGGGVLLISLMSFFLPYHLIIPIHGVVQLVSNSSRSFYLRKNILWSYVYPFLFGAPIGLIISFIILTELPNSSYYDLILALFILYVVFKPARFPELRLKRKGWFTLGIASGIQGPLLGATGPLIAPFFTRTDITKEQLVATKAALQIITHFLKIPLFLSLSFKYQDHLSLTGAMVVGAIIGTVIGVKILSKIKEDYFKFLFKFVLFMASLRLFYKFYQGAFL